MPFKGKKIIVGLTGGIAAYKIPSLIRLLKKGSADMRTIMTTNSKKFITPLTIETVSQNPVSLEMFPEDRFVGTHHIDLADWPEMFIIAPATANFIAKVSSGICDDLLTTVICATKKPIVIAPSMNTNMYLNPITQKNIQYLKSLGYLFIEPGEGELACNTYGKGRMAEPEEIYSFVLNLFQKKKFLIDKRVLVTAGPCREAIDPVRYISNRSSGKMGYAIAASARAAGAQVILISGPSNLVPEFGIETHKVESTDEMFRAVKKEFSKSDIVIMAAAPTDFKAKMKSEQKIKKGMGELSLELTPTIDILNSLKKTKRKGQIVVGFALETENGLSNAKDKLKEKGLDLIILNMIGESVPFESENNQVILVYKNGRREALPMTSKIELANLILEKVAKLK